MRIESTWQSEQAEPESGSWVAINSSLPTSASAHELDTDTDTAPTDTTRLIPSSSLDDDDYDDNECQQEDSQPLVSLRSDHSTRSHTPSLISNMSDDEYDSPEALHGNGNPGSGSGRQHTPNHRKGPRFSWTSAYEATFFRSLCESVKMGLKDNHSFKPEAWDRACTALAERHNAYPNKGHLINKSDNARKKFRLWRGLREDPEFLYNPTTKTVTASEEAWRTHIEVRGIFASSAIFYMAPWV